MLQQLFTKAGDRSATVEVDHWSDIVEWRGRLFAFQAGRFVEATMARARDTDEERPVTFIEQRDETIETQRRGERSGLTTPSAPTLAGFTNFVFNVMGIPTTALASDSPLIAMAFEVAQAIVNLQLACAPPPVYTLAVYNLAGSNVINYGVDQAGAPLYKNGLPFFAYQRQFFRLDNFVPGVVANATDESTSAGLVTPDVMKNLSFANLQQLKDPWGRQYLAFAQSVGTLWGVA